jgi:glycosyltransferase involved in cell wall biosynthesis
MSAPPPVTFVSSHAERGGQEGYLLTLLRALGPDAVRALVVLRPGPALDDMSTLGRPLYLVPTPARLGLLPAAVSLRRVLRAQHTEVVHANGVKAALQCVLATAGTGVPVVWMKHDCSLDGPIGRLIAGRCRIVVGVSRRVTRTFEGMDGVDVRVVHNGVSVGPPDRPAARRRLRELLGAPDKAEVVLLVGRIAPGKGQREAVEAIPEALRARPGTRFAFVGGEDHRSRRYGDQVRARVRALGLQDNVTLLGRQTHAPELIAGADVLIMPSPDRRGPYGWREGFPLVAAEAMAVGTPVVAFDEPAIVEALDGCGELVPAGDSAALGRAVAAVLADPGRLAAMRERGLERAKALRLEDAVAKMVEVYREASLSRAGNGTGSARR